MAAIDGIYAGYMTGAEVNGFATFVFLKGIISGVDPLGVMFDGTYTAHAEGYTVSVTVKIPSGGTVIQGASAGPDGISYNVQLQFSADFAEQDFIRIDTPLGAVNLRLKKIRDLEAFT